ncbi:MAG TPA: PQQ-dependent sugar dehydrogenase, partial [Anaerolineae bacterium]|nr:PQQ-dependent sugar dehydrogenase [Anaerolineae bacterium]
LSTIVALTALAFCVLALMLSAAAGRSAVAQPNGISSVPLTTQSTPPFEINLELIANGFPQLTQVTHADDDSGRLFVVERAGRIRVIANGLVVTPFLDIQSIVESGSDWERGLLSVAFDPDYKTNGTFYVDYTSSITGHVGDIVVARYMVSDPLANVADVIVVTNVMTIYHPDFDHNGGQLQFGPQDDYLYISTGDGSSHPSPLDGIGNSQSLTTTLGKILRIDVHGLPTYTIPASNPFTLTMGTRPEIWAYGLRNPWRFSFDRSNGDLYLGDVGANCWEEIDYQPASSHGGENYGWRLVEGFHYFKLDDPSNCNQPMVPPQILITLTRPITNYNHSVGTAVIGGGVYRGQQYPWLIGLFLFGDLGTGQIWAGRQSAPGIWSTAFLLDSNLNLTSFGEDQAGEWYVTDLNGAVYKIISKRADLATSSKQVSNRVPRFGDTLTYSIVLRNPANLITNTIRVTDVIPIGLSYLTGSFTTAHGNVDESAAPILIWTGELSNTPLLTLTYAVTVSTADKEAITNTALIDPSVSPPFVRSVSIFVNGWRSYLPIIFKSF